MFVSILQLISHIRLHIRLCNLRTISATKNRLFSTKCYYMIDKQKSCMISTTKIRLFSTKSYKMIDKQKSCMMDIVFKSNL